MDEKDGRMSPYASEYDELNTAPYFPHNHRPEQVPRPKQKFPLQLQTAYVGTLIVVMIIFAIAVELVLLASEKHQGWVAWDLQGYGGINALKNIIPVILSMPIVKLWSTIDGALGKMQPWIVLSKGNVRAAESLMLTYSQSPRRTLTNSFKFRHWVIVMSTLIGLGNLALSPLASAILTTISTPIVQSNVPVTSLKTLGVVPDYGSLQYFVAASGYAAAAAIHNLTDPPFLFKGSWALAEFVIPQTSGFTQNQTVYVKTTGVESFSGCQPADSQEIIDNDLPTTATNGNLSGPVLTISGSWSGCNVSFTVPDLEQDQYGVRPLANCQTFPQQPAYQPIFFYFYSFNDRKPSLTFCQPNITLWNVLAAADMETSLLVDVQLLDQNVAQSNVTGLPAFNGISFTNSSDQYVKARALATQTEVPFAIYQGAVNSPGGVSAVINQPDGFLNITDTIYTRFLALSAKSVYFVGTPPNTIISAEVHSLETRLWVYPLAAHLFAGAMLLIAATGTVLFWFHVRERSDTFIACDPTTVGGLLSMTSHSQFPKVLHSGMRDEEIKTTLDGMRFGISRRTWQVVAEGEDSKSA